MSSSTKSKSSQLDINSQVKELLRKNGTDRSKYSQAELSLLAQYEGAGGIEKKGVEILDQFFTPDNIIEQMYAIAHRNGFERNGKVLEPSCGTGRFIGKAPVESNVTAFETDKIAYSICKVLYPAANLYHEYFETAFLQPDRFVAMYRPEPGSKGARRLSWLNDVPFDLVIGNPPYGKHKNEYSSYFKRPYMPNMEIFFMYHSMRLLKPGGLLVFITASNFMRNGITYDDHKKNILEQADFVEAFRMPNGLFRNTEVGTDILVFRKK